MLAQHGRAGRSIMTIRSPRSDLDVGIGRPATVSVM
jgi:hypothetical protein